MLVTNQTLRLQGDLEPIPQPDWRNLQHAVRVCGADITLQECEIMSGSHSYSVMVSTYILLYIYKYVDIYIYMLVVTFTNHQDPCLA